MHPQDGRGPVVLAKATPTTNLRRARSTHMGMGDKGFSRNEVSLESTGIKKKKKSLWTSKSCVVARKGLKVGVHGEFLLRYPGTIKITVPPETLHSSPADPFGWANGVTL